ncbi:MAG TPA: hypothetical protein VK081_08560 [Planctomycetota bacterium]|nr:hypothetical protein [Planctomycetota bacterium]
MRSSALAAGLARGGVLLHAFGGACQVTSPTTETTIDAPALEYLRRRHLERRLAEIFGSAKQRGGSRAEERGTRARAARLRAALRTARGDVLPVRCTGAGSHSR